MPPKKYKKKVVTKRSMTVQGLNIQGSNNFIKGALVENNIAESGQAEEELIIQGFNLTENSNNNILEDTLARDNKVVSYELENEVEITEWQNIHLSFTPELVQKWQTFGFTAEQCKEWINTSDQQELIIQEPLYYVWLRDLKGYTPESLLKDGKELELIKEYEQLLEFQMGEVFSNEERKVEEMKLKVIELLTKTKFELNKHQTQLSKLQTENGWLKTRSEQLTNSNILPLLEEQITKNELTIREKQQIVERLTEKVKGLEGELGAEQGFQNHHFVAYLRDHHHLTPETALNQADYNQLKEEYRVYQEQFQSQQEQPPK